MVEPVLGTLPAPSVGRRVAARCRRGLVVVESGGDWLVGATALVLGLAALSAVPIAQFLSLGYLLAASARVAAQGRFRDAWIGVRRAARVGKIVAGCWLCLLPARFVAALATSAEAIDPGGPLARGWRLAAVVVTLATLVHLIGSCARGGKARQFAWPPGTCLWLIRRLRQGGLYARSRDATCEFVAALHLPTYFRLGLLGFLGSMAWLAGPILLLIAGRWAPLLGLMGAVGLGLVATALPFLQVRFAVEGRFGAIFETKPVRERFRRAPGAFVVAFATTVLAAVPLYFLKIEMVPREIAGLAGVVFVGFLLPARMACGWAYARGGLSVTHRHWIWRGLARLGMVPLAAVYVAIVFFAQYTSWGGCWSLFEQHAFLIPSPFLGK